MEGVQQLDGEKFFFCKERNSYTFIRSTHVATIYVYYVHIWVEQLLVKLIFSYSVQI